MEYAMDLVAGAIAGAGVSPIIGAVDRALAENASGKSTLGTSFVASFKEMGAAPIKYLKSPQFNWIWLIYGATYATANVVTTNCDSRGQDVAIPKLVSTFVVNTSTCIGKDRAFAKMFGASSKPLPVPNAAYAAWLARDVFSMTVFFTLPPIVGREIAKTTGSQKSGEYIAQFALPLGMQTIFTPMHLLGYDIVNNPNGTVADRVKFLQKDYFKNVGMRCVRQAPPWCFGMIANKELRAGLHSVVSK